VPGSAPSEVRTRIGEAKQMSAECARLEKKEKRKKKGKGKKGKKRR